MGGGAKVEIHRCQNLKHHTTTTDCRIHFSSTVLFFQWPIIHWPIILQPLFLSHYVIHRQWDRQESTLVFVVSQPLVEQGEDCDLCIFDPEFLSAGEEEPSLCSKNLTIAPLFSVYGGHESTSFATVIFKSIQPLWSRYWRPKLHASPQSLCTCIDSRHLNGTIASLSAFTRREPSQVLQENGNVVFMQQDLCRVP